MQRVNRSSATASSEETTEKTPPSPPIGVEVPGNVLAKLLVFSLAIIALPISTYFISVDRLFSGNATYGAILAIIMTNVLIALYVVAAFMEDREDKVRKKED